MVALCAIVLYKKRMRGRLYPKAARTGPYAFAQEVNRVDGRVVARYIGIVQIPEKADVLEVGEESSDSEPGQSEQVQSKLQ
jgi:hypothetical protein